MVWINKRRCKSFSGEIQNASPLLLKNTQEFLDVLSKSRFRLSECVSYLKTPFHELNNSIDGLWLDEGIKVPKFMGSYVDYWTAAQYKAFCRQVRVWALDHNKDPFKELYRRVYEVIVSNKKALQLLVIAKTVEAAQKDEKVLFDQQANIKQLSNEVKMRDDQLFVANNNFKDANTQFDRLKLLIKGMRVHGSYLLSSELNVGQHMIGASATEQAQIITQPVKPENKEIKQQHKYKVDDGLEL